MGGFSETEVGFYGFRTADRICMLIMMSAGLVCMQPSVGAAADNIPVSLLPSEQQQDICLLITITKLV